MSRQRDRVEGVISALNGVVGDYLHARGNGLAIEMQLYHRDRPLACETQAISRAHPGATGRLCVLVHGLADTERIWAYPDDPETSYGELLARDLGFTPFYVRYNSGLRISENGELLAQLLEALVASHPAPVREVVLVGHSMGGLVARSACHAAARDRLRWLGIATHLVYLGSPLLGTPLEKLGNVVTRVLRAIRNPHTELVADVIDLRSAGVKDLRESPVVAGGDGRGPAAQIGDSPPLSPLPPHLAQHAVAGTLVGTERHFVTRLLGDGMVRVPSAAGRSMDQESSPALPEESVRIFPRLTHWKLAHHPAVYEQIRAWCAEERP